MIPDDTLQPSVVKVLDFPAETDPPLHILKSLPARQSLQPTGFEHSAADTFQANWIFEGSIPFDFIPKKETRFQTFHDIWTLLSKDRDLKDSITDCLPLPIAYTTNSVDYTGHRKPVDAQE